MKDIQFKPDEVNFLKFVLVEYDNPVSKKILGKLERAEKRIKTSSAKGKGRNLQYWVCERIAGMFGFKFVQSDDDCLVHSRTMGLNGTDVVLTGELADKFPFAVECKACETLAISEWVRQARTNAKDGRKWLVVFKKQTIGGEPLVLMDWSTFEELVKNNLKVGEKND